MIISNIQESVRKYPDNVAIIFDQHQISYSQFDEITNKLANALKNRGVQAGDRIALIMPNLPHCIFSYYAILKAGGIVVPINYMMEDDEFNGVLQNIKPHSIIYWEGFRKYVQDYTTALEEKPNVIVLGKTSSIDHDSLLEIIKNSSPEFEPVQRAADDTAVIQFTSGVTEPPKGIEFSYENLISSVDGTARFFRFNESDTFGAVLPLFFIFSQNVLVNGALSRGGTVVLFSKVDYSKITQSIDNYKISVLAGSPNFYKRLIDWEQ